MTGVPHDPMITIELMQQHGWVLDSATRDYARMVWPDEIAFPFDEGPVYVPTNPMSPTFHDDVQRLAGTLAAVKVAATMIDMLIDRMRAMQIRGLPRAVTDERGRLMEEVMQRWP